jgi:SAM-dependent methyltransferase
MSESKTGKKAHSEEFFGDYRDFWWNTDFLRLMAARLNLGTLNHVLDVGCGIGHWGQILEPFLPKTAHLTGVDMEPTSIAKAVDRAKQQELSDRFRYQVGLATSLPFGDNTFDLVTCQTVLIHLKDPTEGLREMLRVLKPGGLLLLAEPNNFAGRSVANSLTEKLSVDEVMDRLKFALHMERGKKALGLGFNSEGDLIPGLLARLGVKNLKVYVSDKAVPLYPPYASREQQVNIELTREWAGRGFVGWEREELKIYYLAGGGEPEKFDHYYNQALQDGKETVRAIDAGEYHSAGGGIFYLICAQKSG